MKSTLTLFAILFAGCSFAVDVSALPCAAFPDTEVSTNFSFAVDAVANRRLVFTLELQATPSNNVEVAIGCDTNCDGHLSLDESELTVGYDCGEPRPASSTKSAFDVEVRRQVAT